MLAWNERELTADYGGWWFFAFPLEATAAYPYPYFVRGDDVEDASAKLSGAGFTVKIDALPGGFDTSVVATSPRALSTAPEHSQVTVYAF